MKRLSLLGLALCCALLMSTLAPAAHADVWNKKTYVTFPHRVEVPGGVFLEPGKYVFKLANSLSDRHIVQIFNERENHVFATILAISNQRMTPTSKTLMTFYEMPGDQAEPIRAWFYPGDTIGQEFAYPKKRASEISIAMNTYVPVAPETASTVTQTDVVLMAAAEPPAIIEESAVEEKVVELESQEAIAQEFPAQVNQASPRVEESAVAEDADANNEEPQLLAQATPPASPSDPAMPKTASGVPFVGLIGFASLLTAAAVRRITRR